MPLGIIHFPLWPYQLCLSQKVHRLTSDETISKGGAWQSYVVDCHRSHSLGFLRDWCFGGIFGLGVGEYSVLVGGLPVRLRDILRGKSSRPIGLRLFYVRCQTELPLIVAWYEAGVGHVWGDLCYRHSIW